MVLAAKNHSLYLSMVTQTNGMKDLTEPRHNVRHAAVAVTAVLFPPIEYL
jgi:hypothetical protein